MTWNIRPATPSDATLIVDFNCLLAEESEGKKLDRSVIEPGVAAALADPAKARYFIAQDAANNIAGQTMITYEWSDWRNGWFWWIQSVYVRPEFRQLGVFRSLYEHIQRLAAETADVIGLRLYVEEGNSRAQATYRRMGMQRPGYFVLEKYPLGD